MEGSDEQNWENVCDSLTDFKQDFKTFVNTDRDMLWGSMAHTFTLSPKIVAALYWTSGIRAACIFLLVAFLLKFGTFYVSIPRIAEIMNRVKDNFTILTNKQELLIMKIYIDTGILFTKVLAVVFMQSVTYVCLCVLLPCITMLLNPSNITRRQKIPFFTIWFEERYYYIAALYSSICLMVGVITIIGTEGLFLIFLHHTCAMFNIACYRIKDAVNDADLLMARFGKSVAMHDRLIGGIMMHQRAIE
ncbi:hypothetical protein KM043_008004 [Ampulex compressa]|nr:hypothetical protein KM043_008004 [Ampulex compressa]